MIEDLKILVPALVIAALVVWAIVYVLSTY